MISSKISSKGQITLPRNIRKVLRVKPGERICFLVENETVTLMPLAASSARALAGSLKNYARAGSARAEVRKEVARAAAKEK